MSRPSRCSSVHCEFLQARAYLHCTPLVPSQGNCLPPTAPPSWPPGGKIGTVSWPSKPGGIGMFMKPGGIMPGGGGIIPGIMPGGRIPGGGGSIPGGSCIIIPGIEPMPFGLGPVIPGMPGGGPQPHGPLGGGPSAFRAETSASATDCSPLSLPIMPLPPSLPPNLPPSLPQPNLPPSLPPKSLPPNLPPSLPPPLQPLS
mmetsp:Transcript_24935/g.39923  ORF Transcript_24935/g.39923 Transcript_24935/m.39923 type:complete len:200 (+) Transcript_24935:454-1053(+)